MKTKICTRCKTEKPLSNYYLRKSGYVHSWCKECDKEGAKKWHLLHPEYCREKAKGWRINNPERYAALKNKNKERDKETERLRKYGITNEQYKTLMSNQKNLCAICNSEFKIREPVVDHCHNSKVVRGLLCQRCNSVLGYVCDSEKIISNILRYLRKWHG